jgi:hypothetical protein
LHFLPSSAKIHPTSLNNAAADNSELLARAGGLKTMQSSKKEGHRRQHPTTPSHNIALANLKNECTLLMAPKGNTKA